MARVRSWTSAVAVGPRIDVRGTALPEQIGGTRRWARAAALVAVFAVVAGACGDDDDDATTEATSAAAETTAGGTETTAAGGAETTAPAAEETTPVEPTGSEITIGMAVGETGGSGSTQKFARPVAEAWAEYVNTELGGINGHPVNLVVKDTKSDGATGAAVVRELVEQDEALVLLSVDAASESAYGEYTQQQNVPVIGTGYSPATWIALPNWFASSTTIPAVVQAQFVSAKEVGATKWAAISCIEVASCAAAEPLYEPSAAQVGLELGGSVKASTSAPNYTAECLQLIDGGVDYVQLSIAPAAGEKIAADCRRQGYDGWFGATAGSVVASNFTDPELRLAGGLNGFPWYADAEPVQTFRDAMDAAGVEEYQDPTSTATWAALELFRTAMANASDQPTREEVFEAYYALQNEDLDGLLPAGVTYAEGQPSPPINCFWVYTLEDGEFSPVEPTTESGNSVTSGPLKTACAEPLGG
jgi:branched-chain amino acid transport system substrate-binding protein